MLNGVKLTLLVGSTIPVPAPYHVIEALTSVTIKVGQSQASGFELKFAMGKNSPISTLFMLAGGSSPANVRVILVATMQGLPNVLFDGVMTNHQFAPATDGSLSTLTVIGEDLTRVMNQQELDGIPYPGLSASARVASILGRYSQYRIAPVIVPEIAQDTPNVLTRVPLHKGTDLAYINELAKQAGYVFYIEPGLVPGVNLAYWGPNFKITPPQRTLSGNFDSHSNVESISFGYKSDRRTTNITLIQNPETKFPIPIPSFDNPLLNPPLGLVPPGITGIKITRDSSKMSLSQAIQKSISGEANSQQAVTGNGSLDVLRYGSILKARQLVPVRGAGVAFDGLYYVDSVTHKIKRGEYKQDFTLSRNGLVSTLPRVPA